MAGERGQQDLFGPRALGEDDVVVINERCRVRTRDGHRVVSVSGLVLAHYEVGDQLGETHAMVSLVEQGWAQQSEVARRLDVRSARCDGSSAASRREVWPRWVIPADTPKGGPG